MSDNDFQTQTDAKDQEKNELTKLIEGFDDFFNDFDEDQNRIIDELAKLGLNNTEIVK